MLAQNSGENIMEQNTHILSVNMGDGNVESGNITGRKVNNNLYKSDEDAQIMQ